MSVTVNHGQPINRWNYMSAYAIAVKHGYKGTEEEWLADVYGGAASARADAEAAAASAEAAAESKENADARALDSEAYAVGTRGGEAVGSSDPAYHHNAKYYADTLDSRLDAQDAGIAEIRQQVAAPFVIAAEAADMTDHDKAYVYTGSETGYTAGSWYYWNGSAWTLGGTAVDATLLVSGAPADSKTVGDRCDALHDYIDVARGKVAIPQDGLWEQGGISSSDGKKTTTNYNKRCRIAEFLTNPYGGFHVDVPEGWRITVYQYSGDIEDPTYDGVYIPEAAVVSGNWVTGSFDIPSDKYFRFTLGAVDNHTVAPTTPAEPGEDPPYVIPSDTILTEVYATDPSVSRAGVPADAAAVQSMMQDLLGIDVSSALALTWEQGGISAADGQDRSSDWSLHTKRIRTGYASAPATMRLTVAEGYVLTLFAYKNTGAKGYMKYFADYTEGTHDVHVPYNYVRFLLHIVGNSVIEPVDAPDGCQISSVVQAKTELLPQLDARYFTWAIGRSLYLEDVYSEDDPPVLLHSAGEEYDATNRALSDVFPLTPGAIVRSDSPLHADSGNYPSSYQYENLVYVHEYATVWSSDARRVISSATWLRRRQLRPGEQLTLSGDANSARVEFGYDESMTLDFLRLYRNMKLRMEFCESEWRIPKLRPALTAFGASTTVGSDKDYEESSPSFYRFPQYIADVLHMDPYNRGEGTTGFLARGDSGTLENFCDRIYANRNNAALKQADIIILMFGYGNDWSKGELPIGRYDDYYPFDNNTYRIDNTKPGDDKRLTVAELLDKGFTLMGALNWIIRYVSTNYPYARLIPIFGAPSANKDRVIAVGAASDRQAPRKLTITDPYTIPANYNPYQKPGSANIGIKAISEELKKLSAALNMEIIDMFFDGGTFNYYTTVATDSSKVNPDGTYKFAVFSTEKIAHYTEDDPPVFINYTYEWDSHPNNAGYAIYARHLAGKIAARFGYRY